jgi:hypothetical protein
MVHEQPPSKQQLLVPGPGAYNSEPAAVTRCLDDGSRALSLLLAVAEVSRAQSPHRVQHFGSTTARFDWDRRTPAHSTSDTANAGAAAPPSSAVPATAVAASTALPGSPSSAVPMPGFTSSPARPADPVLFYRFGGRAAAESSAAAAPGAVAGRSRRKLTDDHVGFGATSERPCLAPEERHEKRDVPVSISDRSLCLSLSLSVSLCLSLLGPDIRYRRVRARTTTQAPPLSPTRCAGALLAGTVISAPRQSDSRTTPSLRPRRPAASPRRTSRTTLTEGDTFLELQPTPASRPRPESQYLAPCFVRPPRGLRDSPPHGPSSLLWGRRRCRRQALTT